MSSQGTGSLYSVPPNQVFNGSVASPHYNAIGSAPPPPSSLPTTKVELRISCRDLPNMDLLSKSDPFVVLYLQPVIENEKKWKEHGRTETVMNCLDPDFVKSFVLDYYFEMIQTLRFEVYDQDSSSRDLKDQDFIGFCECTLGSIVGEHHGHSEIILKKKDTSSQGKIILHAEEVSSCREVLKMKISARKLDRKDFFGRSDPFLTFFRLNENNSSTAVLKTEVIKNTLNPSWNIVESSVQSLCNGDIHRPIKVSCFDYNNSGNHSLIGDFTVTVNELKAHSDSVCTFDVIHPKKKAKKKYKNSGSVIIEWCRTEIVPTFFDYIQRGMELRFTVAIDFTASNGDPSTPESLHFRSPDVMNQYAQAVLSVGRICEDYDTDKMFPSYGFGAKIPPSYGTVSHMFPLNLSNNPDCFGVQGILEAYYRAVNTVQLYGPTNFSPIIHSVTEQAANTEKQQFGKAYHVLLIITDGIITDFEQTKGAIIEGSSLPLSIIIVGVGPADFDAMEELDGDDVRVSSRGRIAARDIVQFVPYRDFTRLGPAAGDFLAREVLAELPEQVISYMKLKGLGAI